MFGKVIASIIRSLEAQSNLATRYGREGLRKHAGQTQRDKHCLIPLSQGPWSKFIKTEVEGGGLGLGEGPQFDRFGFKAERLGRWRWSRLYNAVNALTPPQSRTLKMLKTVNFVL